MLIEIIVNPYAGKRKSIKILPIVLNYVRSQGHLIRIFLSSQPLDIENYIKKVEELSDRILVLGGDGTINEVINGLYKKNALSVPIAIIPVGTANCLAKEYNIPEGINSALEVALKGKIIQHNLAFANNRVFAGFFSVGFDTFVLEHIERKWLNKWGDLLYIVMSISLIFKYKPKEIYILKNNNVLCRANSIIWSLISTYASYFQIPLAKIGRDSLLLNTVLKKINIILTAFFFLFGKIPSSWRLLKLPEEGIRLVPPGGTSIPYQVDGDIAGFLPVFLKRTDLRSSIMVPDKG